METHYTSYNKYFLQFLKFCIVGISNTCVHYLIFIFMLNILSVHYIISSVSGYFAGTTNSYFWNSKWTFSGNKNNIKYFMHFLLVNVGSLVTNIGTLYVFVEYFEGTPEIGQIFAIATGLIVNFTGCRLFVFNSR